MTEGSDVTIHINLLRKLFLVQKKIEILEKKIQRTRKRYFSIFTTSFVHLKETGVSQKMM
jgi:hypothetical protein